MQVDEVRKIILSLPNVVEKHIERRCYTYDFQNITFASIHIASEKPFISFSIKESTLPSTSLEYTPVQRDKHRKRHNTFLPLCDCTIILLKELAVEAYHQASSRSPHIYQSAYAATIGFFDGVHKGHHFLLDHLKQIGIQTGLRTMAITFDPSPLSILHPDKSHPTLTSTLEKEKLIYECGIDEVYILRMDKDKLGMTSYDFMRNILKRQLNIQSLLLGHDHTFGSDRPTSRTIFDMYGKQLKMEITHCAPYLEDGIRISSSHIKKALQEGDMDTVSQMLGRPYQFSGQVVSGHQLGRRLGFPTANLSLLSNKLLPPNGVYATRVTHAGLHYKGILNIGIRPTLGEHQERTIEVHLLDFHGNLYGSILTIDCIARLRSEQQFDSLKSLQIQLQEDKVKALTLL